MARDLIGPALPPGFKEHATVEDEERDPSPVAGPALPPNYRSCSSDSSDSDEDSSSLSEEGNQESEEEDTGPNAKKSRGEIKMMMTMMMGFLDQPFLLGLRSRMTLLPGL